MTIPAERTRSVQMARAFLRSLLSNKETPRVPADVREMASRVLRHFPSDLDLELAHEKDGSRWGSADAPETLGLPEAPSEGKDQWVLKLTTSQMHAIKEALELYSRVGIGQVDQITWLARLGGLPGDPSIENIEAAEAELRQVKKHLFGLDANASHGIMSEAVPNIFKRAWVLMSHIRYHLSWQREGYPQKRDWAGGMMGVNFDAPWFDLGEPAPVVEAADTETALSEMPDGYAVSKSARAPSEDQTWHVLCLKEAKQDGAGTRWVGSAQSVQAAVRLAIEDAKAPKKA